MRFSTVTSLASVAVLAAATPAPWTETSTPPTTITVTATAPGSTASVPAGSCTSGPIQCCESVEKADSKKGQDILGFLNIVLTDLDILLGLTCSPIDIIGVGSGNACTQNTVCCQNNNVGGLLSIGCLPVFV